MSIDLLSILQSGKRSLSFMSQSVGLVADLDLGTEHLRWMGSNRFMYGFLRGGESCASDSPKLNPEPFSSHLCENVPVQDLS
jgi:hypothetical protein